MTSKERVLAALNHKEPDRVPIDFGGTNVTGMHVSCVAALREYYGLERHPVKVHEPHQMLGWIEDDLKETLGIDVQATLLRSTLFGFPNENWKLWRMPHGLEVLVPGNFQTSVAEDGAILIYPEGDTSAPASGRMPSDGYFFDAIIRQPPLDENHLNPEDNLEEFQLVSDVDLRHFARATADAAATGRAVTAGFRGTAFGDIALVPAPWLKHPKGIRDITEWYISTRSRRDYIHAIFDQQCNIAIENLKRISRVVGGNVDVVFTCGTDFGTQTSAFCSVLTFRELWFPYYKRLNDWIHRNTSWKVLKHSCGSVARFYDSFIEAGIDAINPVQCSAVGMDPKALKQQYGDRLVFWGGGIDTQNTLPFCTPAQVREEALQRCEIFAPGGGFVFNSIHNIQAGTPVENIVSMLDAIHEFNGGK
jgi:uroporphyrinogen-III decarboxylase